MSEPFRTALDLSDISRTLLNETWVKLLENHQHNFALVIPGDGAAWIVFFDDHLGVFDELPVESVRSAESALARNRFRKIRGGELEHLFGDPSVYFGESSFHPQQHPRGRIYSTGAYWT